MGPTTNDCCNHQVSIRRGKQLRGLGVLGSAGWAKGRSEGTARGVSMPARRGDVSGPVRGHKVDPRGSLHSERVMKDHHSVTDRPILRSTRKPSHGPRRGDPATREGVDLVGDAAEGEGADEEEVALRVPEDRRDAPRPLLQPVGRRPGRPQGPARWVRGADGVDWY